MKVRMFGSSMEFNACCGSMFSCEKRDNMYEQTADRIDALLKEEFGTDNVDFKYIDVASPEILQYIGDITQLGELTLPYVLLDGEPLCKGLSDAGDIMTRIRLKLK